MDIVRDNLASLCTECERQGEVTGELLERSNDEGMPELIAEYNTVVKSLDSLKKDRKDALGEVNRLIHEKNRLNSSSSQEGGLLAPKNPDITVTGTGTEVTLTIEQNDSEDLMSPEIARKNAGLGPDDIHMEG